jgi:cell shape-determining protein MreC
MRSLRGFIFSLLAAIILVLFWFYRFEIGRGLSDLKASGMSFLDHGFSYKDFQILKLENEFLKSKDSSAILKDGYVIADVFSSYPFNDQSKLIINRGTGDGIREGMPVLAGEGVLLGRISEVRKSLSEIQTFFDPNWRSSVASGPSKIRSLLVGGNVPALTFIAKDKIPAVGDEVVNIAPEYLYGLYLGKVGDVKVNPTEPWATASLEISYNPNLLDRVFIIIDHDAE